ncbi:MAG: TIGR02996 domain-containing protein, partial [Deltaproteobacteria bacterium]|nr:TIGR02996 domain-containing protein [Deltaproteobacteria bacterium]
MTREPNPKLEAAILADPDDTAAYLVYADWLQSRGDPRGELIVLQHQLGTLDKATELEAWGAMDLAVRAPRDARRPPARSAGDVRRTEVEHATRARLAPRLRPLAVDRLRDSQYEGPGRCHRGAVGDPRASLVALHHHARARPGTRDRAHVHVPDRC